MPEIISLDAAKEHLRIDGASEDGYIGDLIVTAVATLEDFLGRPLIDEEKGWADIEALPANVVHALKVIIADLYLNREKPLASDVLLRLLVGRHMIVSAA